MSDKNIDKEFFKMPVLLPVRYIPACFVLVMCLLMSSCVRQQTSGLVVPYSPSPPTVTLTFPPPLAMPVAVLSMTSTSAPAETVTPTGTPVVDNPDVNTVTDTPKSQLTRLVHSPLIAFTMIEDGKQAVFTIHPDGTGLTRVYPGTVSSYQPAWSPDGQRIAFLSGDSRETAVLTILDYETGHVQQVDFAGVTTFTWSPDGQRLVFTTEPETQGESLDYYVYLVSLPDMTLYPMHKMPSTKRIASLHWSPKGDRILATWQYRGAVVYLRLISLSGEYTTPHPTGKSIIDVSWDPCGKWYAYASLNIGTWEREIWVIAADNTQERMIIQHTDRYLNTLAWSPDSKLLAYDSDCCGYPSGIYVIDLETEAVQQVASPETFAYFPNWSLDSAHLSFLMATEDITKQGYSLNIYSFANDETTRIVSEMVGDSTPVWRP